MLVCEKIVQHLLRYTSINLQPLAEAFQVHRQSVWQTKGRIAGTIIEVEE